MSFATAAAAPARRAAAAARGPARRRRRAGRRGAARCAAREGDERLGSTLSNLDALLGPDEAKAREAERDATAARKAAERAAAREAQATKAEADKAVGGLGALFGGAQGEGGESKSTRPARGGGGGEERSEDIADRTIASLGYLLPLFDGLRYSRFLLLQVPQLGLLLAPLAPAYQMYASAGFFGNLVLFFGLYFGLAKNQSLSPLVRFNAAQAVVLDIVLILPDVLQQGFGGVGQALGDTGTEIQIIFFNTVFLAVYLSCVYAVGSSLVTGQRSKTELPFISDAAKMQAGTFDEDED